MKILTNISICRSHGSEVSQCLLISNLITYTTSTYENVALISLVKTEKNNDLFCQNKTKIGIYKWLAI